MKALPGWRVIPVWNGIKVNLNFLWGFVRRLNFGIKNRSEAVPRFSCFRNKGVSWDAPVFGRLFRLEDLCQAMKILWDCCESLEYFCEDSNFSWNLRVFSNKNSLSTLCYCNLTDQVMRRNCALSKSSRFSQQQVQTSQRLKISWPLRILQPSESTKTHRTLQNLLRVACDHSITHIL